jgi:hypothetical protein
VQLPEQPEQVLLQAVWHKPLQELAQSVEPGFKALLSKVPRVVLKLSIATAKDPAVVAETPTVVALTARIGLTIFC